jgi:GT2 family glycosyltransferase
MSDFHPLISVCIPTYRMGRYIASALESVVRQGYENVEILIVDDAGEDDGTKAIVDAFRLKNTQIKMQFVRHQVNQGVSATRNSAASLAAGELLLFLDPDDLLRQNCFEKLAPQFSNAAVDVVCANCHVFSGEQTPSDLPKNPSKVFGPLDLDFFPASLAVRNFVQPSSTMIRRSLFQKLGGFDVTRELQHVEDWDLVIRAVLAGSRFLFVEEPFCFYRKHAGGATANAAAMNDRASALKRKHAQFFETQTQQLMRLLLARVQDDVKMNSKIVGGPCHRLLQFVDRGLAKLFTQPSSTSSAVTATGLDQRHFLI